jgi:lysophospholipid acyltransferase (LPLAT)-like uncharacterized protein
MKPVDPAPSKSNLKPSERRMHFTLRQRVLVAVISSVGYVVIRILGATLRFAWSDEDGATPERIARPAIYSFWHQCIFPAAALFRGQGIGVMTSLSFDGEFIARIIEKLGFRAVRGSSSRGAVGALLGMRREIEAGEAVAFTIDGPRGPRYVAKPGPVFLAQATGAPMAAFHIALDKAWVLRSWDATRIPKPFSRALLRVSRTVLVAQDADDSAMKAHHAELQSALERVRDFAEAHVREVGSSEFPVLEIKRLRREMRHPVTREL